MTRRVTIGWCLLCIGMMLACIRPASAAGLVTTPPRVHLVCQTSFVMDAFVKRAGLMYSFMRSSDEVLITTAYKPATATASSVSNGFTAMKNAEADFAIMPAVASAAIVRKHTEKHKETQKNEREKRRQS